MWNQGNNPFYDPTSWYGGNQDWWRTPFVQNDLAEQPGMERGLYERFLTARGFGGMTNRDQFGRAQFGRIEDAFKAALMSNPNLSRANFYRQATRNLDDAYNALAPTQRGMFAPQQTRWIRF